MEQEGFAALADVHRSVGNLDGPSPLSFAICARF